MPNLIGQYHTDKSNLIGPGIHLVFCTRHRPGINKPKHYLLSREGKKHRYISSLYPFDQDGPVGSQGAQIFSFDYQGEYFLLVLNEADNQAVISPLKNSMSSINNMELGAKFYPTKPGSNAAV